MLANLGIFMVIYCGLPLSSRPSTYPNNAIHCRLHFISMHTILRMFAICKSKSILAQTFMLTKLIFQLETKTGSSRFRTPNLEHWNWWLIDTLDRSATMARFPCPLIQLKTIPGRNPECLYEAIAELACISIETFRQLLE